MGQPFRVLSAKKYTSSKKVHHRWLWLIWAMPVTSTPAFKKLFWKRGETIALSQIWQKQRIGFVHFPLFPMDIEVVLVRWWCWLSDDIKKMLLLFPSLDLCCMLLAIQVEIMFWMCCSFFHLWCWIAVVLLYKCYTSGDIIMKMLLLFPSLVLNSWWCYTSGRPRSGCSVVSGRSRPSQQNLVQTSFGDNDQFTSMRITKYL